MKILKNNRKIVGNKVEKAKEYLDGPWKRLQKIPGYHFVRDWVVRFRDYRVTSRAAEISYYLMLALFPFIIILISLFGVISKSTLVHQDILISIE